MKMNLFPNRILQLGSGAEQLVSKVTEVWTLMKTWIKLEVGRGDLQSSHLTGAWKKLLSSLE